MDPLPVTLVPDRPVTRPVMLQGWYNLTSIHWRHDPVVVQALLPAGFTVDTFDGSARVGPSPFHMQRIRLPFGPRGGLAAGRFSTLPETNVRTYIRDRNGRRAVWFLHEARVALLRRDAGDRGRTLAPTGGPLVLWSPGVEVRIGRPRRVQGGW
jgi:uncharacterized protein YqjF (DUF2071 family)